MTAPELKRYSPAILTNGDSFTPTIDLDDQGEYVRFADVEAYTKAAIAADYAARAAQLHECVENLEAFQEHPARNLARALWIRMYTARYMAERDAALARVAELEAERERDHAANAARAAATADIITAIEESSL